MMYILHEHEAFDDRHMNGHVNRWFQEYIFLLCIAPQVLSPFAYCSILLIV